MRYFDPTLQRGLVHSVRITPLPGDGWATGPFMGEGEMSGHGEHYLRLTITSPIVAKTIGEMGYPKL